MSAGSLTAVRDQVRVPVKHAHLEAVLSQPLECPAGSFPTGLVPVQKQHDSGKPDPGPDPRQPLDLLGGDVGPHQGADIAATRFHQFGDIKEALHENQAESTHLAAGFRIQQEIGPGYRFPALFERDSSSIFHPSFPAPVQEPVRCGSG